MKRRAFVTLLGGAVTAWPGVTQAQSRAWIGYLSGGLKGDNEENTLAITPCPYVRAVHRGRPWPALSGDGGARA